MNRLRMAVLATAVGSPLLLNAGIAAAQDSASNAELLQLLKQQAELIKKLEQRLATLEGQQPASPTAATTATATADETIGDAQSQQAAGPAPDNATGNATDKSMQVRAAIADTQQGLLEAQLAQLSALGNAGGGNGGGGSGNLRWRGAPVFRSADGYFTFKPRGRLSLDWSGTDGSRFDARNIYGTEATDLRLGAEGTIGKLGYKLDVTFADNAAGVREAYLSYDTTLFGLPTEYYLGNRLRDRSIEGSGMLAREPFMERNAVAAVGAAYNGYFGLGGYVRTFGNNWHLGASITGDGVDNEGTASDSITYSIRGHVNPIKARQGFVHLGSWYYYETLGDDVATINNAPRIGQSFNDNLRVSSGAIADPTRDEAWGYEVGGVFRNFWSFGEYTKRRIDSDSIDVVERTATSISAGWLITGEKPGFSKRSGIWGSTRVLSPVTSGGWGAWEIAVRFDRYDFRDAPNGGDGRSDTVGLNWYINDWSRLMFNYVNWTTDNRVGSYRGFDAGNSFGFRAQVVF
ncbi:OprO/OprP family phosphate-selective porin [Hydrocarboniphaga effusa]|uniref:OprO/OprP family phosphate-selective porin n=1 Tax=Hydrocarboniphaga effusa TaxID=243629 RepID=UPI0031381D79